MKLGINNIKRHREVLISAWVVHQKEGKQMRK
jgi:hypothetical protein